MIRLGSVGRWDQNDHNEQKDATSFVTVLSMLMGIFSLFHY